jgi:hypothetical protein
MPTPEKTLAEAVAAFIRATTPKTAQKKTAETTQQPTPPRK